MPETVTCAREGRNCPKNGLFTSSEESCETGPPDACVRVAEGVDGLDGPTAKGQAMRWRGCQRGSRAACEAWLNGYPDLDDGLANHLCIAGFEDACRRMSALLCVKGSEAACAPWGNVMPDAPAYAKEMPLLKAACFAREGPWCAAPYRLLSDAQKLCHDMKRADGCRAIVDGTAFRMPDDPEDPRPAAAAELKARCEQSPSLAACKDVETVLLAVAASTKGTGVDVSALREKTQARCDSGETSACTEVVNWMYDGLLLPHGRWSAVAAAKKYNLVGGMPRLKRLIDAEKSCHAGKREACHNVVWDLIVEDPDMDTSTLRKGFSRLLMARTFMGDSLRSNEDVGIAIRAGAKACALSKEDCAYHAELLQIRNASVDLRELVGVLGRACEANDRDACESREQLRDTLDDCGKGEPYACESLMERYAAYAHPEMQQRAAAIGENACNQKRWKTCLTFMERLARGEGFPRDLARASKVLDTPGIELPKDDIGVDHARRLIDAWRACESNVLACARLAAQMVASGWGAPSEETNVQAAALAKRACDAGAGDGCLLSLSLALATGEERSSYSRSSEVPIKLPAGAADTLKKHCASDPDVCLGILEHLPMEEAPEAAPNNALYLQMNEQLCQMKCEAACHNAARVLEGGYAGVKPDVQRSKKWESHPIDKAVCRSY